MQMLNEMMSEQKLSQELVQLAFDILTRIAAKVKPERRLDMPELDARIRQYVRLYEGIIRGIKAGVVGQKAPEMLFQVIRLVGNESVKWIDALSGAFPSCEMTRFENDYMVFDMAKWDSRCINAATQFQIPTAQKQTGADGKKIPIHLKIKGRDRRGDESGTANFVGIWLKQIVERVAVLFSNKSSIQMKFLSTMLNADLFYFQVSPPANLLFRKGDSFEVEFPASQPIFKKFGAYCASFDFAVQR